MQIREGAYYRTRGGRIYGPMMCVKSRFLRPFRVTTCDFSWGEDGFFYSNQQETPFDLISEVWVYDTPPSDEPAAPPDARLPDIITDQPYKTLRDEFAMAALQGMLARESDLARNVARYAYEYADAMMEARKK
jgi:hypothetical protein